jgi:hypothetical protein
MSPPTLRPLTDDERTDIEMGRLLKKVTAHPTTRREAYSLLKKVNPQLRFPDMDLEDYKEQEAARRAKEEFDRQHAAKLAEMEAGRSRLRERYSEEHVKEIEALMLKEGIANYDTGAKLWAAEAGAGDYAPSNPQGQTYTMPSDKDLLADPRKWATDQAANVIEEFKRARHMNRSR